jgi:hypothetical protein
MADDELAIYLGYRVFVAAGLVESVVYWRLDHAILHRHTDEEIAFRVYAVGLLTAFLTAFFIKQAKHLKATKSFQEDLDWTSGEVLYLIVIPLMGGWIVAIVEFVAWLLSLIR